MLCLVLMTIYILVIFAIQIVPSIIQYKRQLNIKHDVYSGEFIYYKDFEKDWLCASGKGKYGNRDGFKYQDGAGCYIITIYNNCVSDGNWKNYENVYIGQSVRVYQRVHNHFNGKGNGDVYADIKYGKWVYVRFVRCEEFELNDKEIKLIAAFKATKSYNKTRGGR